ncbi:L-fucose/L-arabinose isomerase family protein [Deinococcus pimensis]|uniref:L-fucose/L-arabinose isomerase family protein n=1 Tax=Deinococcus pimensis TaxID=309888 RepID=UPI0004AC8E0D|nr:L-fucose/L-arabinose isomerase family protein [Deinococcus pimensis]
MTSDATTSLQPVQLASRSERPQPARVGVFGIGLGTYWPQFPGLKDRLEGYQRHVEQQLETFGAHVERAGLVDDAGAAQRAADQLARADLDLLVIYVGTYATSSTVLPIAQRVGKPVLVLNLQPARALDYETVDTAEWLANCCACCVPELSNAFARSRIDFNVVSGMLYDDTRAWGAIEDWIRAASVKRALARARFGFLGHTYPGMLDMYTDPTMVSAQTGAHVEILEMDDLQARVNDVTPGEVEDKLREIHDWFDVAEPGRDKISMEVTPEALEWSARVACGLDRLTRDFDLQGLTYYYRGLNGNDFERLWSGLIVGNSLLTARGIPASGEGDLKTNLAMFILDRLGAGGSYTEFYAMDFDEDFVLMGHDGPGHVAISDRKPVLRGLGVYHGKRGAGISVEFQVRHGPVTILGLTQTADGKLKLLAAEGRSIPGPTLRIGNTNSRLKFDLDPAAFMDKWCEEGPTHHVALGVGHQAGRLRKVARLLGLDLVEVR